MHSKTTTSAVRFWSKVDRRSPCECWEWKASRSPGGYGVFFNLVDSNPDLRDQQAHRFSYRLHYGPIPEGMCVCHRCDNPGCVNPSHLFLGTHQDNMTDRSHKGRQPRGEQIRRSKLTAEQVIEIRHRYANGNITIASLAHDYGMTQAGMAEVIYRRTWRHL